MRSTSQHRSLTPESYSLLLFFWEWWPSNHSLTKNLSCRQRDGFCRISALRPEHLLTSPWIRERGQIYPIPTDELPSSLLTCRISAHAGPVLSPQMHCEIDQTIKHITSASPCRWASANPSWKEDSSFNACFCSCFMTVPSILLHALRDTLAHLEWSEFQDKWRALWSTDLLGRSNFLAVKFSSLPKERCLRF